MSYKDKDKQREAVKVATQRYRERKQGITQQADTVIPVVIPSGAIDIKTLVMVDTVCGDKLTHGLLPACVPEILHARYAREPEYAKVIDRLLNHSLDELRAAGVWIPVWRYAAGKELVVEEQESSNDDTQRG